jgi:hypothetical protein
MAESGAHAVCVAQEATCRAGPTHVLLHLLLLLLLLSHLLLKALHLLLESSTPLLLLHFV